MSGTSSTQPKITRKQKREEKAFVRMTAQELAIVQANAKKYCNGNVSKWIRERASSAMLDVSIKMQDEMDEEQNAS